MKICHSYFGLLLVFALTTISGCTGHYYHLEGNELELNLKRPEAEKVIFLSSLDGFLPHPTQSKNRCWVYTVPAGRTFRYFYLVDGDVFTPDCPMKEKDDFGSENCVYMPGVMK